MESPSHYYEELYALPQGTSNPQLEKQQAIRYKYRQVLI
jgi:hypothetical protein